MSQKCTWIAKSIIASDDTSQKPDQQTAPGDIHILEDISKSVDMSDEIEDRATEGQPSGKKSRYYGMPISANDAISMMRSLLDHMENADLDLGKLPQLAATTKIDTDSKLWTLAQLMVASFGMTFDRSLVLKIFSQPTCEGIRLYLCKKSDPKTKEEFLSVILVGVDQQGNDLLYPDKIDLATQSVQTRSLVVEYGHPPTTSNFRAKSRYKLLRMAEQLAQSASSGNSGSQNASTDQQQQNTPS